MAGKERFHGGHFPKCIVQIRPLVRVMRLYSECIRNYPQDFITVVEALAHTGALAIQNASMYLTLKEDKKSLAETP